MVAVAITGVLLTLKYESASNYQVVTYYDVTQQLPIKPNSKLVQSLKLSKPEGNICVNEFIRLPCKNLITSHTTSDTPINKQSVYLLKGSVIHLAVELERNQIAVIIIERKSDEVDLSQTGEQCAVGDYCTKFNLTAKNPKFDLSINDNGFYVRLDCFLYPNLGNNKECKDKLTYTTEILYYNFTALSINVTTTDIKTSGNLVTLHKDYKKPFEIESMCIITKVIDPDHICSATEKEKKFIIKVTDIKITKELWFIPGLSVALVLLFVIIVLTVVTVIACKKIYCKKNQN